MEKQAHPLIPKVRMACRVKVNLFKGLDISYVSKSNKKGLF